MQVRSHRFPLILAAIAACWLTGFALPASLPTSSSNLAISPDGTLLAIANPDSDSVSFVLLSEQRLLTEVSVGVDPRCVAWLPDGSYLLVTNQGSDSVSAIRTSDFTVTKTIPVDNRPYGIVARPQDRTVYVSADATDAIDVIAMNPEPLTGSPLARRLEQMLFEILGRIDNARVVNRIATAPHPKGLAVSVSGQSLYVTHFLSAEISAFDTATLKQTQHITTLSDGNMAQKIAINPANGRAYMPHIRSNTGNPFLLFDTTAFPTLSAIDVDTGRSVPQERVDLSVGVTSVNLPFDVGFSSDGRRAYVVNLGSEDVLEIDLPTGRRTGIVDVGNGPRGIAIDPNGRTAYVSNSLSDDLSIIDLQSLRETKRIRITQSHLPEQIHKGKIAFFSSHTANLSRDRWMSCATCHFEGEIDGRTWAFTSGPRNTTSLRGVVDTLPLHWSADRDEVQDFEFTIRTLQAGAGLIKDGDPNPELGSPNSGLSADLDALAAFVFSLKVIPSPFGNAGAAITRGQLIFNRPDVGCANCHSGPNYTDSTESVRPFILHDVGTAASPDERVGAAFDTPSLLGVWATPPYLHDGSAATLLDVLRTNNPLDRHGHTSQLSDQELQSLVAFLKSL